MFKPSVPRPSSSTADAGSASSSKPSKATNNKKLVVACMGCRKKKIKCSGVRPACSNCLKLNVECEYPLIKNRGSRFSYKEMMRKRIENLQKYFSSNSTISSDAQISSILSPESSPSSQSPDVLLQDPNLTAEILLSQIQPPKRDQSQNHSNQGSVEGLDPNNEYADISHIPLEILEHLAELYFKNVHCQTYSFLHKPTFMKRLKENKINPALVLALCGLTARYSRHPRVMTKSEELSTAGEDFIFRAKKVISSQVFEGKPDLETVQAMICVIQNDFFRSEGGKTMIYVGITTRAAANLMLHLDRYPENATWVEKECQRRTFWSLMVLDRLAHSSPNWTVQFSDDNFAQLPLPSSDRCFYNQIEVDTPTLPDLGKSPELDANIGLFAYHIQAVMLWCDVNKYSMGKDLERPWEADSKYMALHKRIQSFVSTLPEKYRYSKERLAQLHAMNHAGQFIHLHAEILLSTCVLSRSICHHHNDKNPPQDFIKEATKEAVRAANSLSDMISDMLHADDRITVAPFVGFAVFTVSAVHVTNSFSSDAALADQAKEKLAFNLRLLVELREYWFAVGVWCNILKERYAQRAASFSASTSSSGSSALLSSKLSASGTDTDQDPGSPPHPYLPEEFMQNNPATGGSVNQSGPKSKTTPPPEKLHPENHNSILPNGEAPSTGGGVAWDVVKKHGEQELAKEWNNMNTAGTNTTAPASPSQFADMFFGLDQSKGVVDQFTAEWFTDLQSMME